MLFKYKKLTYLILLLFFISIGIKLFIKYFTDKSSNGSDNNAFTISKEKELMNGDIIFQISTSSQSKAIQLATQSKYSHCGIIYERNGNYYVYEAISKVTLTPIKEWIKGGKDGHYVVKRLINSEDLLTSDNLLKMKNEGDKLMHKNYDLNFEWSDDKIYCSELVWKIYQRAAGLEIGAPQKLKAFNFEHPEIKVIMKERYKNKIPWNDTVVSPAAIFESNLLKTVRTN